ncbi:MAG: hypothetical protein ACI9FJ_002571, partial [Alteromonadaceae bacterium]
DSVGVKNALGRQMRAGLVILYQAHLTPHKAFLNPPSESL